ncbi:MAG: phage holin family protein, partial [Acidobacteria bacterium]|nr:phage holin family protein [Acidobacteriota bacterium]
MMERGRNPMGRFLVNWLTNGVALGAVAWILPGVTIASLPALAVAAVVLGVVNTIVKPVLVVLTLPQTVMKIGVFYHIV